MIHREKKTEEDWTKPQGPMRQNKIAKNNTIRLQKEKSEIGAEKIFEEIMTPNFPNWWKSPVYGWIEEAKQTLSRTNIKKHKVVYVIVTAENKRWRENL